MRQEHPRPCVNTSPATSPATLPTISRNRLYPTRHRTDIPAPRTYIHEGMHEGDYMPTHVYVRCMGESGILRDIGLFDSSKAQIQQPHRPGTTAASSQPSSHTAPAEPPPRPNPAARPPQPSRRTTKQQHPKRLDSRTSKDDNPNSRNIARTYNRNRIQWRAHTAATANHRTHKQPQTTAQPVQ